MKAFVFDLGGTFLRCGVLSETQEVVNQSKISIADISDGQETHLIWQNIEEYLYSYIVNNLAGITHDAPIAVSVPGPVLNYTRLIQAPTINKNSEAIPDLANNLQERTGRKVYFINDLSAAAWHFSRQKSFSRFMVVTISSGIGSKIFDRNNTSGVLDDTIYAGEIGHLSVDFSIGAPKCDCGKIGHLGAIASGRGIERAARQQAIEHPRGFANSLCVRHFSASADILCNEKHILPAALMGDGWSLKVIRQSTIPLAHVLATVFLAAGLEKIIVIGGFATALGQVYLDILRHEFNKSIDYDVFTNSPSDCIVFGNLIEEACLLGAAAFLELKTAGIS